MTDKKVNYTSWPLGRIPQEWHRPELDQLRAAGYEWDDPRDAVDIFEKKVAEFSGAKYGIAVDCCSNGLFLCLKYLEATGNITIPSQTYVSVPMQIIHAGCGVIFEDLQWSGVYQLKPYPVYDGATRFTKDMFVGDDALQVVSFQIKKRLPIGRGGMILTNNEDAYNWLKKASYDGRDLEKYYPEDDFEMLGWHMYMTPEDAARGVLLMDQLPDVNEDSGGSENYSILSDKEIFKNRRH
jgi:dTDP-4-amino-4,6-dideoxygalactose transaminase